MPIVIAENPLYSVVHGSGQCLEKFDVLKQVLISLAAPVVTRSGRGRTRHGRVPPH